jgi:Transposase DDE domain group 1
MTECIQKTFGFAAHFSRRVQSEFTAGRVSSDGGALLLREADRRINLLGRLGDCFIDGRDPLLIKHGLPEMLAQRIYGLALGYEDLNDHEQLRWDPLLGLLSGKRELEEPLAGKSTLNRLELTGRSERYHKISYSAELMDRLLTDVYLESHAAPPARIVLDLDATDIPLYGHQPERFFHGFYDSYCYLPLYLFAGDQLLCARLRPANQDAAAGAVEEVSRIVTQLRQRWPEVSIVLRADSGFCREELKNHRRSDASGSAAAPEQRQAGPGLRPVQLPDPQELVLRTPRGGQGRISRQGGEPALRGHFATP